MSSAPHRASPRHPALARLASFESRESSERPALELDPTEPVYTPKKVVPESNRDTLRLAKQQARIRDVFDGIQKEHRRLLHLDQGARPVGAEFALMERISKAGRYAHTPDKRDDLQALLQYWIADTRGEAPGVGSLRNAVAPLHLRKGEPLVFVTPAMVSLRERHQRLSREATSFDRDTPPDAAARMKAFFDDVVKLFPNLAEGEKEEARGNALHWSTCYGEATHDWLDTRLLYREELGLISGE